MSLPPTPVEVLGGLIRLERVRASAYRAAAGGGRLDPDSEMLARRFAGHASARAAALRTGLEALGGGLDGPEPLEPTEDPLAGADDERALLRALAGLARVGVDTYARALSRLDVPELISTAASAMGGQAGELAALRLALGEEVV